MGGVKLTCLDRVKIGRRNKHIHIDSENLLHNQGRTVEMQEENLELYFDHFLSISAFFQNKM